MATDEAELACYRHAVALLRLHQAQDAGAFVGLLRDPDLDLPNTVGRLCTMVRLALVATGQDPAEFIDQLANEMLAAAADPDGFLARWSDG